jgi:2-polyprenyl-3-methyl-5-hydroxy-6-metoxy-1,4-benzoquinol methylase
MMATKALGNVAIPEEERQPTRRQVAEVPREFDQTFLDTQNQDIIHRDYIAHAFRWGFCKENFIEHEKTRVLDVGCGPTKPLMLVLFGGIGNTLAKSYTGVDLNAVKPTRHARSKIYERTNFLEEWETILEERGPFDLITNFEVIEHMRKQDGLRLLQTFKKVLAPNGTILLSTPVYDGKARAKNHIHEYTIDELAKHIAVAGLRVVKRYGTFMNHHEVRKVASAAELEVYHDLRQYFSQEVMANFLAPLYPDNSRNNLWVLQAK